MFKWLVAFVVVSDQISKYYARHYLVLHEPIVVFEHLNLTLVYNSGGAFGFLREYQSWNRWFFIVLTAGVVMFLIHLLNSRKDLGTTFAVAIALVVGGALGNLVDRIFWGRVTDFADVHYLDYHWPVFNLADSAITIGAVMLMFFIFHDKKESGN